MSVSISDKKNRLRRSMIFMSAQRPASFGNIYAAGPDSIMLDLEDTVAQNQKDAARFCLYHSLKMFDWGGVERIVRINGLDTPYWREDVRAAVAGGADGVRIPKCERPEDVRQVELAVEAAEKEFSRPAETLLMAALESPRGVLNAIGICEASPRLFGVAISGVDFRAGMHARHTPDGVEMAAARGLILLAARAAGVQCFDAVFMDYGDAEGFRKEVILARDMGFDGKSLVDSRQIAVVHEVFTPNAGEIRDAETLLRSIRDNAEKGIGVYVVNGKMLDIAFVAGARRTLDLARASGVYDGDL